MRFAQLIPALKLALVVCFAYATASASCASQIPEQVDKVLKAVGDFVLGNDETLSVDLREISRAYLKFRKMPVDEQRALANERPLNKLVIDFALKPMKFAKMQVGGNKEFQQAYLERMQAIIKFFWPAYQGLQLANIEPISRRPKMNKLHKLLFGAKSKKQNKSQNNADDNEPLTLQHFLQAKREQESWLSRIEQIIDHEDIYSNLEEFSKILQYLNHQEFKHIHRNLLPKVNEHSNVHELKQILKPSTLEQDLGQSVEER